MMPRTFALAILFVASGTAFGQAPVGSVAGTASGGVGAAVGSTVNGGRISTMPAAPRGATTANTNAATGARVDSSIVSTRPVPSSSARSGPARGTTDVNAGLNVPGTIRRGADTSVDAAVNSSTAVTSTTRPPPR